MTEMSTSSSSTWAANPADTGTPGMPPVPCGVRARRNTAAVRGRACATPTSLGSVNTRRAERASWLGENSATPVTLYDTDVREVGDGRSADPGLPRIGIVHQLGDGAWQVPFDQILQRDLLEDGAQPGSRRP